MGDIIDYLKVLIRVPRIVSETPLNKDPELDEVCAWGNTNEMNERLKNMNPGDHIGIAAGDPIVFNEKDTILLDIKDNPIPESIKKRFSGSWYLFKDFEDEALVIVIQYKGDRVWILKEWCCFLSDLDAYI